MLAILSAPGSRGDVNPMVSIGRALKERGWQVVISLAEPYENVARAAGLQVEPIISAARFNDLLARPSMWQTLGGMRGIFNEVVAPFISMHYEVIRRHHRPGETILVSHPLDFASRIHRDVDPSTPLASVHLAPSMLLDPKSPPRMSPWWFELRRPAWAVAMSYALAERFVLNPCYRPQLNAFRRSLDLPSVDRPLKSWWLSPDRVILMYPDWFRAGSMSLDQRFVHAGFPLDDQTDEMPDLPLDNPVVFTSGTAHHHSATFFRRAVETCVELNKPGVLLTTHAANVPEQLPNNVVHLDYVSLAKLLRQSSAIVHHGGIGTTSQALAAGVPQLIRPHAYDQFDNASRIERLGVGRWLRRERDLAKSLDELLSDPSIQENCRTHADKLLSEHGAERAADAIETLARQSIRSAPP